METGKFKTRVETLWEEFYPDYDRQDLSKRAKMRAINDTRALLMDPMDDLEAALIALEERWQSSIEWINDMATIGESSQKGENGFIREQLIASEFCDDDNAGLPYSMLDSEHVIDDALAYHQEGLRMMQEIISLLQSSEAL